MAGIVNLRQARKARARAEARAEADQNAARFGRSRTARASDKAQAERAERLLDGHRRDRRTETGDPD